MEQLRQDFVEGKGSLGVSTTDHDDPETTSEAVLAAMASEIEKQLGGVPLEQLRKTLKNKPPRTRLGKGTRVVVLGGGCGGAYTVAMLRHACPEVHITLVDEKTYFEYTPMTLRAMVQADYWEGRIIFV